MVSDEILVPRFTKEISHISSIFPSMMLNMQSSVSIKAVFLAQCSGSYWSTDRHGVIAGPNEEPGMAALQRGFIIFLTLQTPLSLHEGGWMKVTISLSGFGTLCWRKNCRDVCSHGSWQRLQGAWSVLGEFVPVQLSAAWQQVFHMLFHNLNSISFLVCDWIPITKKAQQTSKGKNDVPSRGVDQVSALLCSLWPTFCRTTGNQPNQRSPQVPAPWAPSWSKL